MAGNLDAASDRGYVKKYVKSHWLKLQQEEQSDCIEVTGVGATVRGFTDVSYARVGLNWQERIVANQQSIRLTKVDTLIGDTSKAESELSRECLDRSTFLHNDFLVR